MFRGVIFLLQVLDKKAAFLILKILLSGHRRLRWDYDNIVWFLIRIKCCKYCDKQITLTVLCVRANLLSCCPVIIFNFSLLKNHVGCALQRFGLNYSYLKALTGLI